MNNQRGFALEATLFVMALISVLMVTAFTGVVTVTRTSATDYSGQRVSYAAEAGADAIMAQLADALEDGALADEELAAVQAPDYLEGFTYGNVEVVRYGGVEVETVTDGPFAGLYSLTQKLEIHSSAEDPFDNTSEIIVTAKAQAIPIFQFGVFYEKDLEVTNGPPMEFAGWVHSNGNIYLSSKNAWYREAITTPNKVFHDRKDDHSVYNGVYINDDAGNEVKLTFDSRTHPVPANFRNQSDVHFDNRLKTDAYGVDSLKVPLPEGVDAVEVILPRQAADGSLERKAKYSWKADWYITVNLDLGGATCDMITAARDGGQDLPNPGDCNKIFNFGFEKFYEGRQQQMADVFDIDMDELFKWTNGNPSRVTNIIYVTFAGAGVDPSLDGVYPIVRLVNGSQLDNSVTVATDRPIYIQGDFNTGTWQAAAVVGDAINILSNAWKDGDHNKAGLTNAANTEVNVAVLAGHTPTPCDHEVCGGSSPYGGGLENYLRFIERWSGRTLTYRGSLVSLAFSQIATAPWSYGKYYTAPGRDWKFDTRFRDPQNLPPGTPVVGTVIHTAFRPVY